MERDHQDVDGSSSDFSQRSRFIAYRVRDQANQSELQEHMELWQSALFVQRGAGRSERRDDIERTSAEDYTSGVESASKDLLTHTHIETRRIESYIAYSRTML